MAVNVYLTHVYSAADYGVVGLLTSLGAVGVMISSLRFENVAILARTPIGRVTLLSRAIWCDVYFVVLATIVSAALLFAGATGGLGVWILALPLLTVLTSLQSAIIPAIVADGSRPGLLGLSFAVTALVSSLLQVVGASVDPTLAWLIWPRVLGIALGVALLAPMVLRIARRIPQPRDIFSRKTLRMMTPEWFMAAPSAMAAILAMQWPIYLATLVDRPDVAGAFWLCFNLLFVPYQVVFASVRPIVLRNVSTLRGDLSRDYLFKLTYACVACAVAAAAVTGLAGPTVVDVFFGEEWGAAARIVPWLGMSLASSIAIAPWVAVAPALRRNRGMLVFVGATVVLKPLVFFCLWQFSSDVIFAIQATCAVDLVTSIVFLTWNISLGVPSRAADLSSGSI